MKIFNVRSSIIAVALSFAASTFPACTGLVAGPMKSGTRIPANSGAARTRKTAKASSGPSVRRYTVDELRLLVHPGFMLATRETSFSRNTNPLAIATTAVYTFDADRRRGGRGLLQIVGRYRQKDLFRAGLLRASIGFCLNDAQYRSTLGRTLDMAITAATDGSKSGSKNEAFHLTIKLRKPLRVSIKKNRVNVFLDLRTPRLFDSVSAIIMSK